MRDTIAIALFILAALSPATAQSPASPGSGRRFEVISVRANRGNDGFGAINTQPGGRFVVVNMSLRQIILSAFGVRSHQLVDAPRWVQAERFDITALTGRDEYPSVVAIRPLVQMLLADRFQLEVEHQRRIMQTYSLVRISPDTLGPEIKRSTIPCRSASFREQDIKTRVCGLDQRPDGTLVGVGTSPSALAFTLTGILNAAVEDATGLTGMFDFTLHFNQEPNAPDGVSVFTAVQEQLGLKLEPRDAPVDVIVVKRIERPTEN